MRLNNPFRLNDIRRVHHHASKMGKALPIGGLKKPGRPLSPRRFCGCRNTDAGGFKQAFKLRYCFSLRVVFHAPVQTIPAGPPGQTTSHSRSVTPDWDENPIDPSHTLLAPTISALPVSAQETLACW